MESVSGPAATPGHLHDDLGADLRRSPEAPRRGTKGRQSPRRTREEMECLDAQLLAGKLFAPHPRRAQPREHTGFGLPGESMRTVDEPKMKSRAFNPWPKREKGAERHRQDAVGGPVEGCSIGGSSFAGRTPRRAPRQWRNQRRELGDPLERAEFQPAHEVALGDLSMSGQVAFERGLRERRINRPLRRWCCPVQEGNGCGSNISSTCGGFAPARSTLLSSRKQ